MSNHIILTNAHVRCWTLHSSTNGRHWIIISSWSVDIFCTTGKKSSCTHKCSSRRNSFKTIRLQKNEVFRRFVLYFQNVNRTDKKFTVNRTLPERYLNFRGWFLEIDAYKNISAILRSLTRLLFFSCMRVEETVNAQLPGNMNLL